MDDKFRSRKFMLATVSMALAALFLAVGKLTGGEWVMVTGVILGLYGAGNVMENRP